MTYLAIRWNMRRIGSALSARVCRCVMWLLRGENLVMTALGKRKNNAAVAARCRGDGGGGSGKGVNSNGAYSVCGLFVVRHSIGIESGWGSEKFFLEVSNGSALVVSKQLQCAGRLGPNRCTKAYRPTLYRALGILFYPRDRSIGRLSLTTSAGL